MNVLFWQNLFLLLTSGTALYWIVSNINPLTAIDVTLPFVLFLVSSFIVMWTFLTFVGFFFTEIFKGRSQGKKIYQNASRRSFLVSIFLILILIMQFFQVFGWLEAVFLFIFMVIVEVLLGRSKEEISST